MVDFQADKGIVVDGQIGADTAKSLGISLSDAAARLAVPFVGAGLSAVAGANPLIAVATAVLPSIARAIAADQSGKVAGSVAQAVTETTGAVDAAEARAQLTADPGIQAALQIRLVEIANDQEQQRLDAAANARRDDLAAEVQRRDSELSELRTQLADVEHAREISLEQDRIGGASSKGPMTVTLMVTGGFVFALGAILVIALDGKREFDPTFLQLFNVTLGALTVAFSTVVTFWLGSSEGSRRKDVIAATKSEQQAASDRQAFEEHTRFTTEMVDKAANRPAAPQKPVAVIATRPSVSNFTNCLNAIFEREGGFVNDPKDRGGPTNFGITQATLSAARGGPVSEEDVKKLGQTEARDIYRSFFWNQLRCDDLPLGVDLIVFDLGVHSGPANAARMLQEVVGTEQDGSIGDLTISACKTMPSQTIIEAFHRLKMTRYATLTGWDRFAHGWTNRANAILKTAIAMAGPQTAAA